MNIYDRYIKRTIIENELPDKIDIGRFLVWESDEVPRELTYSQFPTNKVINQGLLLDKYKNVQEVFQHIYRCVEKSHEEVFDVIPLIQNITENIELNEFEELLYSKLFHIEEIFRNPHSLLKREIEKVNVSRVKRIPSKSYRHLASHTEDWLHKSIVNFKPSRILSEELEININIYENQLAIAFLERCLAYINIRYREVNDINNFLNQLKELLKEKTDGYYKKVNRNFELMSKAYDTAKDGKKVKPKFNSIEEGKKSEPNSDTEKKIKDLENARNTADKIRDIKKRLLILRKSNLYVGADKRMTRNITLKNTNVLNDHKHYRYIKLLWSELDKINPEVTETQKKDHEQQTIKGIYNYVNSIIVYCLKNYLGYEIHGNYGKYICHHPFYSNIDFDRNDKGILNLTIGKNKLQLVVLGNEPEQEISHLDKNMFVFFFSENDNTGNDNYLSINPFSPNSVERVASFIRKYLIKEYLDNLDKKYEFPHLLRNYIYVIQSPFLEFSIKEFNYQFIKFPSNNLDKIAITTLLKMDERYIRVKKQTDKENLINEMENLIEKINENSVALKNDFLYCLGCNKRLSQWEVPSLTYFKCSSNDCNTTIKNQNGEVTLEVEDPKRHGAKAMNSKLKEFWGMDYIKFKLEKL